MNVSRSEEERELQPGDNANRMYTPEEDEEILEYWWDKNARTDLCHRLGRTYAAAAQRFYAIVKAREIDPKEYRRQMRQKSKQPKKKPLQAKSKAWSDADEMKLWRLMKSGVAMEEISQELGHSQADCLQKLGELKDKNQMTQASESAEPEVERFFDPMAMVDYADTEEESQVPPADRESVKSEAELEALSSIVTEGEAGSNPGAVVDEEPGESDDILETLKHFPRQVRNLESRMLNLENQYQLLQENMEFVLEELSAGLKKTGGFLEQRQAEFTTFQRLKDENEALVRRLDEMQEQVEVEKRELRKTYQEVEFWLGEFMNLRKIEKVASLSDLIPKLKYSYDKFGVLLNVDRE